MMCRSTLTLPWQPGFDSHEIVKELMNSPDYTVRVLQIPFLPFKEIQIYITTLQHQLQ